MKRIKTFNCIALAAMVFVITGTQAAFAENPAVTDPGNSAEEVKDSQLIMPDFSGILYDSVLTVLDKIVPESDTVYLIIMPDSFYTDSLPVGTVVMQEPLPDSAILDSLKLRLTAPMTVKVPDVMGMELLQAKEIIEGAGLVFFPASQRESSEYPAGTVMLLAPQAGTAVNRGESITVISSAGVPDPTVLTTAEGVEVHLYGDIGIDINSVAMVSGDSTGFELEFGLEFTNPYEHWIKVGKLRCEMQINKGRIVEDVKLEDEYTINPGRTAAGKISVPVSYSDIPPPYAQLMLGEAEYRLVGTVALSVESGFSRKYFDVSGTFELFGTESAIQSKVRERLETIAVTPPDYPDAR